jgi:glycosyltransferase involved in cell wall biosynthesis
MRKKILVLTSRYPYPTIGGDRLRIMEICKSLSNSYDLTLLSLCDSEEEFKSEMPIDGIFTSIHKVFLPTWHSYWNCIRFFFSGLPLQIIYYKSKVFENKVSELVKTHSAIFSHLVRTSDYIQGIDVPVVVEMTDAISLNYDRLLRVNKAWFFNLKSLLYVLERYRLNAYERNAHRNYKLLCFVSQTDLDYLYGQSVPNNVMVCGNGVDFKSLIYRFNYSPEPLIAFIGNMNSLPNQDAVLWFVKNVMPLLVKTAPFRFRVIGRVPKKFRSKFSNPIHIEFSGEVDSVADETRDCFVGVCPVRFGAGVQNKVLEYMALGLPTVSSRIGAEGFSFIEHEHLMIADDPRDVADVILKIWNDREFAEQLTLNARVYIENSYSWGKSLEPLLLRIGTFL